MKLIRTINGHSHVYEIDDEQVNFIDRITWISKREPREWHFTPWLGNGDDGQRPSYLCPPGISKITY